MDAQRTQIQEYIDKKDLTLGALADKAKVGRWSLKKWMDNQGDTITIRTWAKVSSYMAMNP